MKYEVRDTVEEVRGQYGYIHDVAVLLIFFNRPSKIQKVFQAVKKARPSRLYLYQDGERENREEDVTATKACREIVEDIDWNCTVHKLYQTENYGCDPSEYIAQKWMFSYEEMGIVLEDDDVPSQSFFPFCIELLEKYRDDKRIAIICGMNNFDVTNNVKSSYFFSKRGSIWGWASWRRFLDLWDGQYSWLEDETKLKSIADYCGETISFEKYKCCAEKHKSTGKEHYESIMFAAAAQNKMLNIVPKYNMISNIGVDSESTHSVADIRLLCSRTQKLMYKKTYEIDFPLIHPTGFVQNMDYDKKYIYRWYHRSWDRFEVLIRRIIFTGHTRKR